MFPSPIQRRSKYLQLLYQIALPIALVLWLVPLFAVILTSIRSFLDIAEGNYWGLPKDGFTLQNYVEVFVRTPMLKYTLNSIIITVCAVIGAVALSALAGYGIGKFKFKGNMFILALFVAGNFVPFQILMIPVRNMSLALGLYNTIWALVLFHMAFQTGFAVFFLRNFIQSLPDSIFESARIDGLNEWQIFLHIALPCIRPALASIGVLLFTFIWNDYFWALVLINSDKVRPITVGLATLRGQWIASWHLISAGAIIGAIPAIIVFFIMQKHFIAGLTLGADKG